MDNIEREILNLKRKAAHERDQQIEFIQSQYKEKVKLIEETSHPPEVSMFDLVLGILPLDRVFTVYDLWREATLFRSATTKSQIQTVAKQMLGLGLVVLIPHKIANNRDVYTVPSYIAKNSRLSGVAYDVAFDLLLELGPMDAISLVVEMHMRGFKSKRSKLQVHRRLLQQFRGNSQLWFSNNVWGRKS